MAVIVLGFDLLFYCVGWFGVWCLLGVCLFLLFVGCFKFAFAFWLFVLLLLFLRAYCLRVICLLGFGGLWCVWLLLFKCFLVIWFVGCGCGDFR